MEQHLAMVQPLASHYAARTPECRDDLVQVGLLGLIRAAERYEAASQVPFSAYCRGHIRGAILHYLRDTAPLVRTPRRLQECRQQLNRLERRLSQELGRRPRASELRSALGVSESQWAAAVALPSWQTRLWLEPARLDGLAGVESETVTDQHHGGDELLQALMALPQQQRQVIQEVILAGRSLREVARRQGSSAATMHRRLHAALAVLRTRLSPESGAPGC